MDYATEFANILWRDFEPTRGAFDLELLDTLLSKAKGGTDQRRKLAFRFQVMNEGETKELPTWHSDEDVAKGFRVSGDRWSLDWDHKAIRAAHLAALTALGNWASAHEADIAWVEIGSYGFYGEWHHAEHEEALGFEGRVPGERHTKWRTTLASIVNEYLCHFKTLPLSIAFDSLKAFDDTELNKTSLERDPVFLALEAGHVGLFFDCLGKDNTDWLNNMPADISSRLSGPFGGEFCDSEKGAKRAIEDEKRWPTTLCIVRNNRWNYVREAGASLITKQGYGALSDYGKHSVDELLSTLESAAPIEGPKDYGRCPDVPPSAAK
ncbi:MAG: hypothetical protein U0414_19530 [Polyangiaceae bacterium]